MADTASDTTVQHTPGPWRVENDGSDDYFVVSEIAVDEQELPVVIAGPLTEANARLIAAALELLDLVKMFNAVLTHEPGTYADGRYLTSEARQYALEIIEKAEGRQP